MVFIGIILFYMLVTKYTMISSVCVWYKGGISFGMLVPNSRDWHEKNGNRILHTTKHPLNTLCLRKADWNALLILLITLHCYKQSKNSNSLTCRGFSRFRIPAVFCLPAYLP